MHLQTPTQTVTLLESKIVAGWLICSALRLYGLYVIFYCIAVQIVSVNQGQFITAGVDKRHSSMVISLRKIGRLMLIIFIPCRSKLLFFYLFSPFILFSAPGTVVPSKIRMFTSAFQIRSSQASFGLLLPLPSRALISLTMG